MASRGKSARTKGHQYERDIAKDFQKLGWDKCKRHLESQAAEAEEGRDLDHTEPFIVQCKARMDYVPVNTINEIKKRGSQYPLLITKGDRKPAMAVMYWEDLKEIIQMLVQSDVL